MRPVEDQDLPSTLTEYWQGYGASYQEHAAFAGVLFPLGGMIRAGATKRVQRFRLQHAYADMPV